MQSESYSGDWIEKIKSDHNTALKQLYDLYRDDCIQWLKRTYHVHDDMAKDAFQLSIVVLYEKIVTGNLSAMTSSIKSYLYGIARNKLLELLKIESRHSDNKKKILIHYYNNSMLQEFQIEDHILEKVRQIMENMGDPCKSILELFYFQKLKMGEISEITGLYDTQATRRKKYKCLQKLQKLISKANILPFEA